MIISISGRMGSGKTTLCNELVKQGFIKISFADYFKKVLSIVYGIDLKKFYDINEKNSTLKEPLFWNSNICTILSNEIDEKIVFNGENKEFYTIRECLQYIGTDILRKHDPEFHIKKTIRALDKTKDYCLDDCRFINEKKALEKIGAFCIFIFRPSNFNYSNHPSETELNWTMFNYYINNSISLTSLLRKFNIFVRFNKNKKYSAKQINRDLLIKKIKEFNYNLKSVCSFFNFSKHKLQWLCEKYLINIKFYKYRNDDTSFLFPNEESAYFAGLLSSDGCIKKTSGSLSSYCVELTSSDYSLVEKFKKFLKTDRIIYKRKVGKNLRDHYYLNIISPFIVENLKLWNLEPRKSKINKIPDIARNNKKLMNSWLIGLIDGDGCISIKKGHKISLFLLCSKEIALFLKDAYSRYNFILRPDHQKIQGLYEVHCNGKYFKKFYNECYNKELDIGLPRKWDRIKNFVFKTNENHLQRQLDAIYY